MLARRKRESGAMTVCLLRDGEPPECLQAVDGRNAIAVAVGLILRSRKLRAGDRLTVELDNHQTSDSQEPGLDDNDWTERR